MNLSHWFPNLTPPIRQAIAAGGASIEEPDRRSAGDFWHDRAKRYVYGAYRKPEETIVSHSKP